MEGKCPQPFGENANESLNKGHIGTTLAIVPFVEKLSPSQRLKPIILDFEKYHL